ncbi:glutathione S-transferase family protein [Muricoccus radiodurans]|uniref:glutathione S-transferase family protein n=1 Tax=Muricoccus radiodurans TaxID=2231721 RepID=UPI003CF6D2EC
MIRVHHLEASRSHRVLWLLEELGLPYEVIRYARDPVTMAAPPSLRAVHPLGKSPVVEDGGEVLAESGAILETLLDRHDLTGRLRPAAGSAAHRRYLHWMHFAEGSVMPPLLVKLYLSRLGPAGAAALPRVDGQIADNLDYMEAVLAEAPFFAGEAFSAADIQMGYPMEASAARGGLSESRPRLWDWLARMRARPAWQRAIERGGRLSLPR